MDKLKFALLILVVAMVVLGGYLLFFAPPHRHNLHVRMERTMRLRWT